MVRNPLPEFPGETFLRKLFMALYEPFRTSRRVFVRGPLTGMERSSRGWTVAGLVLGATAAWRTIADGGSWLPLAVLLTVIAYVAHTGIFRARSVYTRIGWSWKSIRQNVLGTLLAGYITVMLPALCVAAATAAGFWWVGVLVAVVGLVGVVCTDRWLQRRENSRSDDLTLMD